MNSILKDIIYYLLKTTTVQKNHKIRIYLNILILASFSLTIIFFILFSNQSLNFPYKNNAKAHPANYTLDECLLTIKKGEKLKLDCKVYTSLYYALNIIKTIDTNEDKTFSEAEKKEWGENYLNLKKLKINSEEPLIGQIDNLEIPNYEQLLQSTEQAITSIVITYNYDYPPNFFNSNNVVEMIEHKPLVKDAVSQFVITQDSSFYIDIATYRETSRFRYGLEPKPDPTPTTVNNNIEDQKSSDSQEISNPQNKSEVEKRFQNFVENQSPFTFGILTFFAIMLGLAHALQPGHGKAFISAVILQNEDQVAFKSIVLGIATTISHILIVILIGGVYYLIVYTSLFGNLIKDIDSVVKILQLVSYLGIIIIGATLTYKRIEDIKSANLLELVKTHHNKFKHTSYREIQKQSKFNKGNIEQGEKKSMSIGSLITSGVTGGINPCVEALTVLLVAIGIGQFFLGVILVTFFSIGMSFSLIGLAFLVSRSKSFFNKYLYSGQKLQYLQLGSSVFILLLGFYLFFGGL